MDILTPEQILDHLDDIIRTLEMDENAYYIALDVAHQLRDELHQVLPGYAAD